MKESAGATEPPKETPYDYATPAQLAGPVQDTAYAEYDCKNEPYVKQTGRSTGDKYLARNLVNLQARIKIGSSVNCNKAEQR